MNCVRGRRCCVVDAAQGMRGADDRQPVPGDRGRARRSIPVLNKIDLPAARPRAGTPSEIASLIGRRSRVPTSWPMSAKTGVGVPERARARSSNACPAADRGRPTPRCRALIFDSQFDQYRGVVSSIRIMNGKMHANEKLEFLNAEAQSRSVVRSGPPAEMTPLEEMGPGEVGYLIAGIKDVDLTPGSGDTITTVANPATDAASGVPRADPHGLQRPVPGRLRGLPENLRDALGQAASSTTRAITFEPEIIGVRWGSGSAAGSSVCCTWRSSRSGSTASSDIPLVTTAPNVRYEVHDRRAG